MRERCRDDTSSSRVGLAPHTILAAACRPSSRRCASARDTNVPPRDAGQHTLKGVEVVTHDDAIGRREARHQMRVAVVDDVKEVEVLASGLEPARIVPHAVDDAIGSSQPGSADPTSGSRVSRRTIGGRSSLGIDDAQVRRT